MAGFLQVIDVLRLRQRVAHSSLTSRLAYMGKLINIFS
jgi:hypothetical protein